MRSAEHQATIPLKFLIIIHNYANVQTINQSLSGFQVVVTSLDGINRRSFQTSLRGENDSKQSNEIQAIFSQAESLQLILKISATYRLVTVICQQLLTNLQRGFQAAMSVCVPWEVVLIQQLFFSKTMCNKTSIRFGFYGILNNQGLDKFYRPRQRLFRISQ